MARNILVDRLGSKLSGIRVDKVGVLRLWRALMVVVAVMAVPVRLEELEVAGRRVVRVVREQGDQISLRGSLSGRFLARYQLCCNQPTGTSCWACTILPSTAA